MKATTRTQKIDVETFLSKILEKIFDKNIICNLYYILYIIYYLYRIWKNMTILQQ